MAIPTLTCEIAFGTDDPLTTSGSVVWTDVSSRLQGTIDIHRGRQRELDQCEAGQMTLELDNSDRALEPGYSGSIYYPNFRPMRRIRLSATIAGTTYRLFTGYIDRISTNWQVPNDSTVQVEAFDAFGLLALLPLAQPFPQQTSSARIDAALTAAGWPAADRSITAATRVLPAKAVVTTDNQTTLPYLQSVSATQPGTLFCNGSGQIVYFGGFSNGSVSGTLGDANGEIQYDSAVMTVPSDLIYNDVRATRDGGKEQRITDATSKGLYAYRETSISTLNVNDGDALTVATAYLARYKTPYQIFDPLTFLPIADTTAFQFAFGCDVGKTVTVKRTPPGGGARYNQTCTINGVQWSIAPTADWTVTLRLLGAAI